MLPANLPAADLSQDPPLRPSYGIKVVFQPQDVMVYSGTLSITHNDASQRVGEEGPPRINIPLSGRGSDNACPEAQVATCAPGLQCPNGENLSKDTEIVVRPLDIVNLDGFSQPMKMSKVESRLNMNGLSFSD